jgi:hypothetical protein
MPDGKVAFRHLAHFELNFGEVDLAFAMRCKLAECSEAEEGGFINLEVPLVDLDELAIKAQQNLRERHGFA